MPLNKTILTLQLFKALNDSSNAAVSNEADLLKSQFDLADAIASAVDSFVRTGQVIIPPGQQSLGASATGPVQSSTVAPQTGTII
jgi:hypothetical protein